MRSELCSFTSYQTKVTTASHRSWGHSLSYVRVWNLNTRREKLLLPMGSASSAAFGYPALLPGLLPSLCTWQQWKCYTRRCRVWQGHGVEMDPMLSLFTQGWEHRANLGANTVSDSSASYTNACSAPSQLLSCYQCKKAVAARQLQGMSWTWWLRGSGSFSCELWTPPALLSLQYLDVWGVEVSQWCQCHGKAFGTVGDPKPLEDGGRNTNFFTQPLWNRKDDFDPSPVYSFRYWVKTLVKALHKLLCFLSYSRNPGW